VPANLLLIPKLTVYAPRWLRAVLPTVGRGA
jgi:hypothetical protein